MLMSDSNLGIEYAERNNILSEEEFRVFQTGPSFCSIFFENISPFRVAADIPVFFMCVFITSGDVCPRFQSQDGSLTCVLH